MSVKKDPNSKNIVIRTANRSDHERIIAVMPDWWGGRDVTVLLPKLFLVHFCDTSFVAERDNKLIGFLVGFMSQSLPNEAYIHFIGIDPNSRKEGLGAKLYSLFFEVCRERSRRIVRAQTSPVNIGSVMFHTKMGFQVEQGKDKVFFTKYV